MTPNDERLHGLLTQWRDIEPAPNFQAQVWRRLRDRRSPADRPSLLDLLWASRLAYATAAAAAVLLWIAALAMPARAAASLPAFSAFHRQSLTGAYAQLLTGRTP